MLITRRILWTPTQPDPTLDPTSISDAISLVTSQTIPDPTPELVMTQSGLVAWQPRAYKKRTGNGHKSLKVRDLLNPEKDSIREFFLFKNGMIGNDDCTSFKLQMVAEVAIFQITGFVSYLHCKVAEGLLTLQNLIIYEAWMRTKYHDSLWARYNYAVYVKVRTQNQELIAAGQAPTAKVPKDYKPKFATFPKA
jgi:hypothetical protein